MSNLGEETRRKILFHGYKLDDVDYVGVTGVEWWEPHDFFRMADEIDYDNGYGWQEINPELYITMKDGSWFKRKEYDGSEWWSHVEVPMKPFRQKHATKTKILVDID